jgi:hypothetical protein
MDDQTKVLPTLDARRLLLDVGDGWKLWKAEKNSPFRLLPGNLDLKGRPRSSFPVSDGLVQELLDRRLIEISDPSNPEYGITDAGAEHIRLTESSRLE